MKPMFVFVIFLENGFVIGIVAGCKSRFAFAIAVAARCRVGLVLIISNAKVAVF